MTLPERLPRGDDGTALIEFVGLSVLLLVPLVYLLLTVFTLQRGAFAAGEAAREAGRAYATADDTGSAAARARTAARLALDDAGVSGAADVSFAPEGADCGQGAGGLEPALTHGTRFVACVRVPVGLPFADRGLFAHLTRARVTVTGQYAVSIDQFRPDR